MKYIVNCSGGLSSFEALDRTIQKYGKDTVLGVFADTKIEDPDLYRFLDDQEKFFGIRIVRLADGRTPFQVWYDERCITLRKYIPCSQLLKRNTIQKWLDQEVSGEKYTLVFGFDWDEIDRMNRLEKSYTPIPIEFPLLENTSLMKCDILEKVKRVGISPPRLYLEGFHHNNCGGGCVKGGKSHWAFLLQARPETYRQWEEEESAFRRFLGRNVSILKDYRGDERKPYTLSDLRIEIENGGKIPRYDWGGCGCFGMYAKSRLHPDKDT